MLESLTVVTPTWNSGFIFRDTAEKVDRLRKLGCRWIVVDSGSEDVTLEIAKTFADEVLYEPPGNMYAAINRGVEIAETEWVTYINSDDLLYVDAVTRAISQVASSADVIYGNIDYIDAEGRLIYHWRSAKPAWLEPVNRCGSMPIPQQGSLFRKLVWADLKGFDTEFRYSADYDFFYRALRQGYRFSKISHPRIAAFRLHGRQFTQEFSNVMTGEVSLSQNRGAAPRPTDYMSHFLWRASNWDSYVTRFLRNYALHGKFRLGSSTSF